MIDRRTYRKIWNSPMVKLTWTKIQNCNHGQMNGSETKLFSPRASERRVLLVVGSSHLHVTSSSLTSSHPHILASSHLLIFTSSHLHICSPSHLLIFTSSHLHICSSSHLLISTFSHLRIFTSSHPRIFTSWHLRILTSSHLLILLLSCLLALYLFPVSLLRHGAVPTRRQVNLRFSFNSGFSLSIF
jgi:hypothetical protein